MAFGGRGAAGDEDRKIEDRSMTDQDARVLFSIRRLVLAAREGLSKLLARRSRRAMLLPCILPPTGIGDPVWCLRIVSTFSGEQKAAGDGPRKEVISNSIGISAGRHEVSVVDPCSGVRSAPVDLIRFVHTITIGA